jgi:alpha-beta hydrolase superfamily lysophospholipase
MPSSFGLENTDLKSLNIDQLKQFANQKFWADDIPAAQSAINEIVSREDCNLKTLNHECFEVLMNQAICDIQEEEFKTADKLLTKLYPFADSETKDTNGGMDGPDCANFLAECKYHEGEYKKAESLYQTALSDYKKVLAPLSPDLAPSLEGLAGCYYRKADYQSALPYFEELLKIDISIHGDNTLRAAWSLMNLSDLYKRLNNPEESRPFFDKAVYIFRKVNADRIIDEYQKSDQGKSASPEQIAAIKKRVYRYIFGEGLNPEIPENSVCAKLLKSIQSSALIAERPDDFYNWRLKRTRKFEAPGTVTVDPSAPMKGVIICVHGLGLHQGTYDPFAKEMAKHGFCVIAFDVRGFGAYKDDKGYDQVDLNSSVNDLAGILKLMRHDHPNTNLFLLGESMGGAVALRVASIHPELLDGLISSVPSGNRYGAKREEVKVGLKLLSNKNKPFDVGQQIIRQATGKEGLREQWQNDPEARMNLSPVELLQFQKFMNQNVKAAELLKSVPVIIFQGYGDKLVKPEGTLALYNAIATADKDMVFVGHAEHLIFEEGQFSPSIINGLSGWLTGHLKHPELALFH